MVYKLREIFNIYFNCMFIYLCICIFRCVCVCIIVYVEIRVGMCFMEVVVVDF